MTKKNDYSIVTLQVKFILPENTENKEEKEMVKMVRKEGVDGIDVSFHI